MKISVEDLARRVGGEVRGDGLLDLTGAAALDQAGPGDLAFADSPAHAAQALASPAGCVLVPAATETGGRTAILSAAPKLAFARALAFFHPHAAAPLASSPETTAPVPGIHPTAVVDRTAFVHPSAEVGPHAVVAAGAAIGARSRIGAGAAVGEGVQVGSDCTLHPRVVLYPRTRLGDRVIVHAGAVLGCDGFGYVKDGAVLFKFPQVGALEVGDDVEIGAGTTIDRGALGKTVIGRGTKIDNLVQIAHNVAIGEDCAVSAQCGIAGSARIEDGVTLAGQVGVADHVRIEQGAIAGAQAGIPTGKVVRRGQVVWGTPARPLDEFKRQFGELSQVGGMRRRLRELEDRLDRLQGAGPDASSPRPEPDRHEPRDPGGSER